MVRLVQHFGASQAVDADSEEFERRKELYYACLATRTTGIAGAFALLPPKWFPLFGAGVSLAALGQIVLFLATDKGLFFGGKAWWNDLRLFRMCVYVPMGLFIMGVGVDAQNGRLAVTKKIRAMMAAPFLLDTWLGAIVVSPYLRK